VEYDRVRRHRYWSLNSIPGISNCITTRLNHPNSYIHPGTSYTPSSPIHYIHHSDHPSTTSTQKHTPMSGNSPPPIGPPFTGYIGTTHDALIVFEAARLGKIPRVTRRLLDKERSMVQSGAVFVFDEHESGIKRWTDTLVWSPSRILGNFLVSHTLSRS
jgi:hypothetical protein